MLFLLMIVSQRAISTMIRRLPNFAFVLIVAARPGSDPVGFGSIRMVARPGSETWAQFGFLVAEPRQGQGIGTRIARSMYETAVALGVFTGGGSMLIDNGASRALAERFGFPLSVAAGSDPLVPGRELLRSRTNLSYVLAFEGSSHPNGPPPPLGLVAPARGWEVSRASPERGRELETGARPFRP